MDTKNNISWARACMGFRILYIYDLIYYTCFEIDYLRLHDVSGDFLDMLPRVYEIMIGFL